MDREFMRFPHTPHLVWLGEGRPRDDKVLDAGEVAEMLADEVIVEEKVDGANVGLSVDADGRVWAQNRGRYIEPGGHPQFGLLWPWIDARVELLRAALSPELIVFGEWCFAVHSVRYEGLPDWFLGFDVFDRRDEIFWSTTRRDALFAELQIVSVPQVFRGHTDLTGLVDLLEQTQSCLGPTLEGLYIRHESADRLLGRAKLVRREFLQHLDEHWSRQPLRPNRLVST